ncbi:LuxR C-terminal-related transcriptional regulator [Bradyrhizobium erythrophlei]|uniref:response regulator transcription factor n=1 Tax=Bradyrhizobium erythrophlei TaxID=1437360 RepID=UPI0035ED458D
MAANVFLIIDDHPIFSQALVTLLGDAFPGSKFLTAGTLDQGRGLLLSSSPPPIVLLDINLPDSKGAHGARELIRVMPGVKIIALSAEDAPDRQTRLLRSGVHGFLSKTVQPDIFIAKLNELIRAQMRTQRIDSQQTSVGQFEFLSERQKAVIIELARGRSNKEIALSLGIGAETVKTHVSEIIRRLNVRNRAEAIRHFMMRGAIIESNE